MSEIPKFSAMSTVEALDHLACRAREEADDELVNAVVVWSFEGLATAREHFTHYLSARANTLSTIAAYNAVALISDVFEQAKAVESTQVVLIEAQVVQRAAARIVARSAAYADMCAERKAELEQVPQSERTPEQQAIYDLLVTMEMDRENAS